MARRATIIIAASTALLAVAATAAYFTGQAPGTDPWARLRAQGALAGIMRDPTSLILTNLQISQDGKTVCGEVNGKNGYGAYAGKSGFVWRYGATPMLDPGEIDRDAAPQDLAPYFAFMSSEYRKFASYQRALASCPGLEPKARAAYVDMANFGDTQSADYANKLNILASPIP